MQLFDTVKKSPVKKTIHKVFNRLGVKILPTSKVWFDYTAYPPETKEYRLQTYLERLSSFDAFILVGSSAFSEYFLRSAQSTYPNKQYLGTVALDKDVIKDKANSSVAWVLCDLDRAYLDFKFLLDNEISESQIIYNSIFAKSPWRMSDFYDSLYGRLAKMPPTMNDDARLLMLAECVRRAKLLNGSMLEIGTYKGGTGYVICETLAQACEETQFANLVYLVDWYKEQSSEVTFESVKNTFEKFPFARVLNGMAEQVLPNLEKESFSFVHVDINIEKHVVDQVLMPIYKQLNPGGMILFDNYYFRFFSKYWIDRFAQSVNEHVLLLPSISQGLLIKTR